MPEASTDLLRNPRQVEIIGIVGGLGPFANLDFERKILESAQSILGASVDQDFPEWIVSSVPQTPDRTLAIQGKAPSPVPWLLRSLHRLQGLRTEDGLESVGADFAVITCNTAHAYLDELRAATRIPILSMIGETAKYIKSQSCGSPIGILATTGTLIAQLYHDALKEQGLEPVSLLELPDGEALQQRLVMEPIYGPTEDGGHKEGGIKGMADCPESRQALEEAARTLIRNFDAGAVIAGCTEIPLVLKGADVDGVLLVDPARVLADVTIRRAYGLYR